MGKRREPRKGVALPVRIFGTDSNGRIFSETVTALDISQTGARLGGVHTSMKVDEIIGVSYGKNKVHFRVKWIGARGQASEGQVGLQNLSPQKLFWDVPLPHAIADHFRPAVDRRRSPRIKCSLSVELHRDGEPVIWGKASDISLGGCFVEMAIPLKTETHLTIAIWLGQTKLRLPAQVASTSPGFGIGIRFNSVSAEATAFRTALIDHGLIAKLRLRRLHRPRKCLAADLRRTRGL